MATVRVEQVPLVGRGQQPLLLVLAVDLDQRRDDRREPRGGDGLVVQARHAAAVADSSRTAIERLRDTVEQGLHAGRRRTRPQQTRRPRARPAPAAGRR